MSALQSLARFVRHAPRDYGTQGTGASRRALIDTLACVYAGCDRPVTESAFDAVSQWGPGAAWVVGYRQPLMPPFAAMVNAAAAHSLDYDDYDAPANSHPSAVVFPTLLAMAPPDTAMSRFFDAYIVGVEIIERLGEAMNMGHYRAGWHTTVTLGTFGAAGALARLNGLEETATMRALSLCASMASALTNQGGFSAKPLHAGLAAKNGVMAFQLAKSGITASPDTLDGPISTARAMGGYNAEKFAVALSKLGKPWAIVEHGVIAKAYPSCGYTHRVIDAAIELHTHDSFTPDRVTEIEISIPDYYLDLLTYSDPCSAPEAMFSAEYNVAAALVQGCFDFDSISESALACPVIRRLCRCARIVSREPLDRDVTYDPRDPDWVEVLTQDGVRRRVEVELPTGSPWKPMTSEQVRAKFDQCTQEQLTRQDAENLWQWLNADQQGSVCDLLALLK